MVRLRLISALVLMTSLLCDITIGYPDGGGDEACDDMIPQHVPNVPQAGDGPYNIIVTPNVGGVRIRVQRTGGGTNRFRGICIQVHLEGDTVPFQQEGQFDAPPNGFQYMGCGNGDQAITHTNNNRKTSVTVDWTPSFSGRYVVAVMVDLSFTTFWLMQSDAFDVEVPTVGTTTTPFITTTTGGVGDDDCFMSSTVDAMRIQRVTSRPEQCDGIVDIEMEFEMAQSRLRCWVLVNGVRENFFLIPFRDGPFDIATTVNLAANTATVVVGYDDGNTLEIVVPVFCPDDPIPGETCDAATGSTDICANDNRFRASCRNAPAQFNRQKSQCCPGQVCDAVSPDLAVFDCPNSFCVVVDGSDSVTRGRFASVTAALHLWIDITHVARGAVNWGYVTFSSVVDSFVPLSPFRSAEDLEEATVNELIRGGGRTFTNFGIQKCREMLLDNCVDDREAPGLIILITDGNSNEPENTELEILTSIGMGINVFVISIGDQDDYDNINEYRDIVGDEWTEHVASFADLEATAVQLFGNLPDCPSCGDGIQDAGEECDDGNRDNFDGCRNACVLPFCGDGIIDPGEGCDDGNNNNNDGCRNSCVEPFCGDGQVDAGEQCDDSNNNNNDNCRNDCTRPFCGDGIQDQGEACDRPNNCRDDCTIPECGDGIVDQGEACDDGNNDNFDGCRNTCVLPRCGDGIVDAGEDCDDSNDDECRNCRIVQVGPCDGCKIINGVGFNPSSNCGCFLTCLFAADGGLIEFVERPCEPLFWDQELLTCVNVNQTQCPNDPCAQPNTDYWGMKCCAGGWLCDSGRTIAPILCEVGEGFNEINGNCELDATCTDICVEPNTNECYLIPNGNDPSGRTYFAPQLQQDGNETLILMTCPVNTAFKRLPDCVCSDLTTEEPVCDRDYMMDFEQDPIEDLKHSAYIRNEFVAVNTGEGYGTFDANDRTKLIVPRYANEDWRDQWMIVATFDTMGNANPDGPVFSNSGCMDGVSIEIGVVGNEIVVTVVTSDATQVVRFPLRAGITTVTVTYDGVNLKVDVDYFRDTDETQTVPLTGWVVRRACAVQWGYGYDGRYFNGRIYFGDIWLCLPGTRGF